VGPVDKRDIIKRTARYRRLLAIDQSASRRTLDAMWDYRDVMGTLLTGCQGTPFEGLIWQIAEAEVLRIAHDFDTDQHKGACRKDVPPELFGSLIIGTHLLLGQRMSRLEAKPDLGLWVWAVQTLIHDGASPASEPALPRPEANSPRLPAPARRASPARAAARASSPRRTPSRKGTKSVRNEPNRRSP
jgi:hypothetical protein